MMKLNVNKDSVGANTSAGPAIDTKQVSTEVLVENGGTVGLGGIYTQDESSTLDQSAPCWAIFRYWVSSFARI
jgi:type IV pilus assembly protein PilQ